jgi:cation-transporting ATPase 13A2
LYYAEVLPNSKVTAFSNSRTQKIYIDEKAKEKGLTNLTVITGNAADYEFEKESFDRVLSIEASNRKYPNYLAANDVSDVRAHEEL